MLDEMSLFRRGMLDYTLSLCRHDAYRPPLQYRSIPHVSFNKVMYKFHFNLLSTFRSA